MKKLLLIIDYQNDFVNGSMSVKSADKIENIIEEKIKHYLKNHDDIAFTMDTHDEQTYLSTLEGKTIPIKHTIINTSG